MIMKPKIDNKRKRYIIYTRCSTDDQAVGDFTTLDAQAHHCKNMIDAFGYELANFGKNGVIYDDGFSGKDLNRPGIQSVLQDVRSGKRSFDGIIFLRLDRLTRNTRDLYALIDLFREKEIAFVSVRENLDSSTAIGRVVIGILGILSAFERELTGERVKASCVARARQGKWVAGKPPFGYKHINDGQPLPNGRQPHKIIIDPETGPLLKRAWEMAAENKSLGDICRELTRLNLRSPKSRHWHKTSLVAMIKSPFYKGYIRYAGELNRGNHPALVDENLWDRANKLITSRLPGHKFVKRVKEYLYLLSGRIKCGECGSHYVAYSAYGRNKKFYYYTCSRAKQSLGCNSIKLSATQLDSAVLDFFRRASQDQSIIVKAIGEAIMDSRKKLDKVEKEIAQADEKLKIAREKADKLLSLAMDGAVSKGPAYKTKMDAFDNEILILQDKLSKLEAQRRVAQISNSSSDFLYSNIRFAMKHIDQAPPEAKKALLNALIKYITIFDDHIEMRMYVGHPFEEIATEIAKVAQNNPKDAPKNSSAPQNDCRALVPTAGGLYDRPKWLPRMDSNHDSQIQNLKSYQLDDRAKINFKLYRNYGPYCNYLSSSGYSRQPAAY